MLTAVAEAEKGRRISIARRILPNSITSSFRQQVGCVRLGWLISYIEIMYTIMELGIMSNEDTKMRKRFEIKAVIRKCPSNNRDEKRKAPC
ncbi:MAG: hypothetical protein OEL85_08780, partial [Desulfobulbaceae bacterium]|nr:hypothetical protein [Desulfobulbaceae bacterium]